MLDLENRSLDSGTSLVEPTVSTFIDVGFCSQDFEILAVADCMLHLQYNLQNLENISLYGQ